MEDKKYLNEEQYQQNAKKLKKIGKITLIVGICMVITGIILLILGFIGFGKAGMNAVSENIDPTQTARGILGGFGLFALGGFLNVFGLFVSGISAIIIITANRREIAAFTTQQVMPVAKEGINEMAPTIGNAAGEIAKRIKKGLKDENKEQ